MKRDLPTRLTSEPLIEVVSEVRFDAAGDTAVNLLPGILHEHFGAFDRQSRAIPPVVFSELLASDPSLAYRPRVSLAKNNFIIQVGAKTVSVACRAPYPGWAAFSEFVETIARQSFLSAFDWVSLKYIDVIAFNDEAPTLDWLDAEIHLGGRKIEQQPSSLRVEPLEGPVTTVVQIVCPVRAEPADGPDVQGILVDVDTIHREGFTDFSQQFPDGLDQLHDRNKRQFFSLLTETTEKRLGPEYP